jgi:cobyrinic acid a,c-diamide synthase
MARSLAAVVHGYSSFDPGVRIAGVIANYCGSEHHARWLRESLEASLSARLMGAVMRGSLPELASRHLGLVSANSDSVSSKLLEQLADASASMLDVEGILACARSAPLWREQHPNKCHPLPNADWESRATTLSVFTIRIILKPAESGLRTGIVFSAFDPQLPENLDGLYLEAATLRNMPRTFTMQACVHRCVISRD